MNPTVETPTTRVDFMKCLRSYKSRFPLVDNGLATFRSFVYNGARVNLEPIDDLATFRKAFAVLASKSAPFEAMELLVPEELTLAVYIMLDDPLLELFANITKFGYIASLTDKACVAEIEDYIRKILPSSRAPSVVDSESEDEPVIVNRYSPEFSDREESPVTIPEVTPPPSISVSKTPDSPTPTPSSPKHIPYVRRPTPYTVRFMERISKSPVYTPAPEVPQSTASGSDCPSHTCAPHSFKNCYQAAKDELRAKPDVKPTLPTPAEYIQHSRSPSARPFRQTTPRFRHKTPPRNSKTPAPRNTPLSHPRTVESFNTIPLTYSPYTVRRIQINKTIAARGFLDLCFPFDGITNNFRAYTLDLAPMSSSNNNFDHRRRHE